MIRDIMPGDRVKLKLLNGISNGGSSAKVKKGIR